MLIGPMHPGDNPEECLVEPPGIAPGSSPLMTCAFISIVGPKPDTPNIGPAHQELKNAVHFRASRLSRSAGGWSIFANRRKPFAGGLGAPDDDG